MRRTRRGRVIPFREARGSLIVTGLDISGLLVRLIDRKGTPFFLPRSKFESFAMGRDIEINNKEQGR